MSKSTKVEQLRSNYLALKNLPLEPAFRQVVGAQEWDGPSIDESSANFEFVQYTMDLLFADGLADTLPYTTLNSVVALVQNTYTVCNQFQASKDFGSYQSAANQLDSMVYHLRIYDIHATVTGMGRVERLESALALELQKAVKGNKEVEALKNDVRSLIEPSISGSLSKSFMSREKKLLIGRVLWGILTIALAWLCADKTTELMKSLSDALSLTGQSGMSRDFNSINLWTSISLRTVILVPIYAAFGFAFAQYKKERDFEEEYAHKAAVATALPNYGDLAREPTVRDQIVTAATSVIFAPPTKHEAKATKSEMNFKNVKELLDALTKLVQKKE